MKEHIVVANRGVPYLCIKIQINVSIK